MGNAEQISFWIDSSTDDLKAAEVLHQSDRNLQALFFVHLSIEKLIKAFWVKANKTQPPRIHDLIFLHDQSGLDLDDLTFMTQINGWNIEGWYPDYKKSLNKVASKDFTQSNLTKAQALWHRLQEKLQSE